jgi:hypothetical protein
VADLPLDLIELRSTEGSADALTKFVDRLTTRFTFGVRMRDDDNTRDWTTTCSAHFDSRDRYRTRRCLPAGGMGGIASLSGASSPW